MARFREFLLPRRTKLLVLTLFVAPADQTSSYVSFLDFPVSALSGKCPGFAQAPNCTINVLTFGCTIDVPAEFRFVDESLESDSSSQLPFRQHRKQNSHRSRALVAFLRNKRESFQVIVVAISAARAVGAAARRLISARNKLSQRRATTTLCLISMASRYFLRSP